MYRFPLVAASRAKIFIEQRKVAQVNFSYIKGKLNLFAQNR